MKKLFTILLALAFTSLSAQHCYTLYQDELKSHTGFNTITALAETPDGEKLIGGESSLGGGMGLLIFDGVNVTKYKEADSDLPNNIVRCISVNGDSAWVGTDGGLVGIELPKADGWRVYTTADGLPSNEVTAILILEDGTKWLGFNNGSIASILIDGTITAYDIATGSINDIVEDENGRIWAAVNWTSGGNDRLVYFDDAAWIEAGNVELAGFKDLEVDKDGYLWGNTWGRLQKFDPVSFEILEQFNGDSFSLSPVFYKFGIMSSGHIVLSTNVGLLIYKDGDYQMIEPGVSGVHDDLSYPLFVNANDEIWFSYEFTITGFDYGGLGKLIITDNNYEATPSGNTNLCFGNTMDIDAGTGYENYFWNGTAGEQLLVTDTAGLYTLAVDEGAGCFSYDTVQVNLVEPYQEQEICVVTVDDGNVIVAWERSYGKNVWYTKIYRESSQLEIYDLLDSIYIDDIQAFVDLDANPQVKSYKYRISVVDSCGNESKMSPPHTTIHFRANVAVNGGVNMAWTHYEGQEILSYEIRKGITIEDVSDLIATVSSSENSYFYQPAEDAGALFYRVEAVIPKACDPTAKKGRSGPFTRSVSNLKSLTAGEYVLVIADTTLMAAANLGTYISKFVLTLNGEPSDYGITLTEGEGDSHNDWFTISNDSVFTNAVFPLDTEMVYSIRVVAGFEEVGGIADWIFEFAVNRMVGMRPDAEHGAGIHIYPNPSDGVARLEFSNPDYHSVDVVIFDLSGRAVKSFNGISGSYLNIDGTTLGSGIFMVEVRAKEVTRSKLIIR